MRRKVLLSSCDLVGIALRLGGVLVGARRRLPGWFLDLRRRQSTYRILVPAGGRGVSRTAFHGGGIGGRLAGVLRQDERLGLFQQVTVVAQRGYQR